MLDRVQLVPHLTGQVVTVLSARPGTHVMGFDGQWAKLHQIRLPI